MAKPKTKNKNISSKKYLVGLISIIVIIFLVIYCYKWYQIKSTEEYQQSYLVSTGTVSLEITDIDAISDVFSEVPNSYFVYISYTGSETIYSLEQNLRPIITDNDIQDIFYYIDVTDIKEENSNYKSDIATELGIDADNITKLPTILYFENSSLVKSISGNNGEITSKLEDLLNNVTL